MSSSNSKQTNSKKCTSGKPSKFCKVCYDAGKPITEYSAHYVRDRIGGQVICPLILNQQCKYCKKLGHTPSHCPSLEGKYKKPTQNEKPLAANNKTSNSSEAEKKALQFRAARLCESPPPPECNSVSKNYFNVLANEVANEPITIVEKAYGTVMNSWANIVVRPKAQKQEGQVKQAAPVKQEPKAQRERAPEPEPEPEPAAQAPAPAPAPAPAQAPAEEAQAPAYIPQDYSNCSWADY